jgi:3-isopropylmalate/(R)-2-methylmalate dehydratase small subunit
MEAISKISSPAMPLDAPGVDTDQILPARFLKQPRSSGYGNFLFYDRRYDSLGRKTDFALNCPPYDTAKVMVVNSNFGCGSSREGAVYAMIDYGFRCVIAPSFGDIFYFNALNNGLLAIRLPALDVAILRQIARNKPETLFQIDLPEQTVSVGNRQYEFEIDQVRKRRLLNGEELIESTFEHQGKITDFIEEYSTSQPWLMLDKSNNRQ